MGGYPNSVKGSGWPPLEVAPEPDKEEEREGPQCPQHLVSQERGHLGRREYPQHIDRLDLLSNPEVS